MDEQKDAVNGTPAFFAPFSAGRREMLAVPAMYVLAYLYTLIGDGRGYLAAFTLGLVVLTELLYRGTPRIRECWVWLGCLAVILWSIVLPKYTFSFADAVWDRDQAMLFLHIFAVYWILCRSGRLCGGESSRLLPLDGLNGFLVFPFGHFFLRIRTLFFGIRSLSPKKEKTHTAQIVWSILAVLAALAFFFKAVDLLGQADSGFADLTDRFFDLFRFEWDEDIVLRFFLSLPVGAYLFGLTVGAGREEPEKLRARGASALRVIEALRRVPETVWCVVLALFSVLYAAFFALQGSYLFGAFTRTLPEGFIVSQYAREGFFELCKVMAVNFALLWCVTRSVARPVREHKPLLILCAALLAESIVFAVIALSKLGLYIDCFGFTPLRLQSSWLVCVLFAGCVCAMVTLLTRKKTLRAWMIFGAVTLSLLHLY